jgi:hypothetical protein
LDIATMKVTFAKKKSPRSVIPFAGTEMYDAAVIDLSGRVEPA